MEKKEYHKKPRIMNRHHIIGQAEREIFNVFEESNVIWMEQIRHNALHSLFRNLLTPKEQIEYLVGLYEGVLSGKTKNILSELLSMSDKDFYAKGLVKRSK